MVVAEGNIGTSLDKVGNKSVFVSSDGGDKWYKVLDGSYTFEITDHGSLIVAGSRDT